jgi:D-amino peptidase
MAGNFKRSIAEMKILIAVDMEGITGVVTWNHVTPTHAEYPRFRRLMTQDVNAAVQGAIAGGADEVIVSDGHWNSDNILIEELDGRARLNSGSPSPLSMVEGVQRGVDAVLFVGYHARIGTENAILDHTWSSARVQNLWLNGRVSGEIGLNAAVCGHYGVPVLMISGDQSANREAEEWIAGIEHVIVKQATGRWSAELLPPAVTQPMIAAAAERAVSAFKAGKGPAPLPMQTPVTVGIEFFNSDMADKAALLPGSRRDGRKIEFDAADMPSAYWSFRAAINLA